MGVRSRRFHPQWRSSAAISTMCVFSDRARQTREFGALLVGQYNRGRLRRLLMQP